MPQRSYRRFAYRPPRPPRIVSPANASRTGWLRYGNLKVEAAIFLLIAVTFAAVLGKSALTRQALTLTPQSDQAIPYTFSDAESGGRSSAALDPSRPMAWRCDIRAGSPHPYCGYGLQLTAGSVNRGLDFSRYQSVTLRLTYH
ncbi:MAG: hypothetical protein QM608_13410, partial [Caulobacter sp.]